MAEDINLRRRRILKSSSSLAFAGATIPGLSDAKKEEFIIERVRKTNDNPVTEDEIYKARKMANERYRKDEGDLGQKSTFTPEEKQNITAYNYIIDRYTGEISESAVQVDMIGEVEKKSSSPIQNNIQMESSSGRSDTNREAEDLLSENKDLLKKHREKNQVAGLSFLPSQSDTQWEPLNLGFVYTHQVGEGSYEELIGTARKKMRLYRDSRHNSSDSDVKNVAEDTFAVETQLDISPGVQTHDEDEECGGKVIDKYCFKDWYNRGARMKHLWHDWERNDDTVLGRSPVNTVSNGREQVTKSIGGTAGVDKSGPALEVGFSFSQSISQGIDRVEEQSDLDSGKVEHDLFIGVNSYLTESDVTYNSASVVNKQQKQDCNTRLVKFVFEPIWGRRGKNIFGNKEWTAGHTAHWGDHFTLCDYNV